MLIKYVKDNICKSGFVSIPSWWRILIAVTIFYILAFNIQVVNGKKGKNPNRAKSTLITNPEWSRSNPKKSECRLGRVRYPLNATWSPDLGPPFGVWKCVQCTCTPVQKKRRIVARVMCRNIKSECPKIKCPNAVLTPGSCCKLCPKDKRPNEEFIMEEPNVESMSDRDFAVLLNGRTTRSPLTTQSLATGRIFLRRGTLHYSFVYSSTTDSPSMVQFLNEEGTILEELEPQPTPYEVNNGRICGTWTRVPRQYRNLLMDEKLWVALVPPHGDDIISGQISRYKGVNSEVFSSLLSPQTNTNQTLPGGGTALISVSASSDSLHISLIFNGIFKSSAEGNVSITVELRPTRNIPPVIDTIVLPKVFSDINVAEIMTTLGEKSLRLLARGKVQMVVTSSAAPELRLEGMIMARATCNVYHSVLTTDLDKNIGVDPPSNQLYGAGWGLLYVLNDGDFNFEIKLEQLPRPVQSVSLQLVTRKKTKTLEDITLFYKDGWVNGTYGSPTFRDLDTLFRGKLEICVVLAGGGELSGALEAISATEALRSLHPTLLKSPEQWMAATSWVAVDEECVMHYDVYVAGRDPSGSLDPTWSLQLRENDTLWDPRLDHVNTTLELIISGREIAAHTTTLIKASLSRLHHGATYLDLSISDSVKNFHPAVVLSGRLKGIEVPPHCLLYPDTSGGVTEGKEPETRLRLPQPEDCKSFGCLKQEEDKPIISKKCIDNEKRVYEDGSTWKSPMNNCARCMCTLGKINCHDEPCPKATCQDALTLPGQCCPSCPVVSGQMSERVCKMDDDNLRNIGSFWHPFLAPKGFDQCVTCYCNVTLNGEPKVECSRVSCPPLNCKDSEANFREESCCPKCPATTTAPSRLITVTLPVKKDGFVSDPVTPVSEKERKAAFTKKGGCIERGSRLHPNGDMWYHRRSPNYVNKCISCTCKDGGITCSRDECPTTKKNCRKGENCKRKKKYKNKSKHLSKKNSSHRKRKNRRKEKRKLYKRQLYQ